MVPETVIKILPKYKHFSGTISVLQFVIKISIVLSKDSLNGADPCGSGRPYRTMPCPLTEPYQTSIDLVPEHNFYP